MTGVKVLAISGSLRAASFNTRLLRAFAEPAMPHSLEFAFASIDLPLYNPDLAVEQALEKVEQFKRSIAAADAVLIATPEYNYGPPGPLKNAIDWASRPAYRSVFRDKPVAVIGAATGVVGSARAQGQLKQILLGMASQVFPHPEYLLGNAAQKFDDEGKLIDSEALTKRDEFLAAFHEWVNRVRA